MFDTLRTLKLYDKAKLIYKSSDSWEYLTILSVNRSHWQSSWVFIDQLFLSGGLSRCVFLRPCSMSQFFILPWFTTQSGGEPELDSASTSAWQWLVSCILHTYFQILYFVLCKFMHNTSTYSIAWHEAVCPVGVWYAAPNSSNDFASKNARISNIPKMMFVWPHNSPEASSTYQQYTFKLCWNTEWWHFLK